MSKYGIGTELLGSDSGSPLQELRAESRYLSILDASPDLICRFEPDTTLTFVNRAYADYFEAKPADLLGRRFLDFVPQDIHGDIRAQLSTITAANPSRSYEHVVTLPDGSRAWQYWTDIGLFDEHGTLVEFQSIGRDVTPSHALEQELKAKNAALMAREAELQLVIDSIPSRIWYKDDKNGILRLNKAAAQSMGVEREKAEGANTYDLFGPMAKKYHDDDLKVIRSGQAEHGIIERYTPASGEDGWVTTDKIPFPDPTTGDPRLMVVATDITELKKQEAQLQVVNQNLDNFASLVSHDLRAPLRHMLIFSEMLEADFGADLPEDARAYLTRIIASGQRMQRIIQTFVDFSRSLPTEMSLAQLDLRPVMDPILR